MFFYNVYLYSHEKECRCEGSMAQQFYFLTQMDPYRFTLKEIINIIDSGGYPFLCTMELNGLWSFN